VEAQMSYYFPETVDKPFAVERTVAKLRDHGFGVLIKIDVQATLEEKIAADFRPYVILSACNPRMAHQALPVEDQVGTMLPCNVIV
jgi:uncharacterized protein (DUF302 family)